MLFNSLSFLIFFVVFFFLYWGISKKGLRAQNVLILIASYLFYGWWDWRFLFLLMFSTAIDYYTGLKIHQSESHQLRKFWLWLSIVINVGFLAFFKYYNFFIDSFATLLQSWDIEVHPWTLNILLPVGISFYTFHGLSYILDIYHRKFIPTKNVIDYSVFVSFFPLLVAGPIERAAHLLPQVQRKREFQYHNAAAGLKQILWGLVKKIVIADSCGVFADQIFDNSDQYNGSTLALGAVFFAFQIYGDFSGYTDIALGTARLLGFSLLRNFSFPYFSRDIAEFWRRWHISLSSWFKDYVYIPLGGGHGGLLTRIRNTFIIFLLSGFWHGANWTFIVWGILNALYFLPLLLTNRNRSNIEIVARGKMLPSLKEAWGMFTTFLLTTFAWIFFRAENLPHAFQYISEIFSSSVLEAPQIATKEFVIMILIIAFMTVEWLGREGEFAIEHLGKKWGRPVRWAFYSFLLFIMGMYMQTTETAFIYFQF